jgi:ATP-dependent Clp protease protease subunit
MTVKKDRDDWSAEDAIERKLLDSNVHLLSGDIETDTIDACIKWILYENLSKSKKTLTIYINSYGGDLYQAFALIDVMKESKRPIKVIGIGAVMSAAFLIFACGTKGMREAGKNASFMCHQYSDAFDGKHHDLKATMAEGDRCNKQMIDVLCEASGLTETKIKSKLLPATDVYLSPQQVLDLGIADTII